MNRVFTQTIFIAIAGSVLFAQDASSIYAVHCANCHGADGSANTVLGRTLKLRDLRSPAVKKLSEGELVSIIGKGIDRGKMPGFEKKLGGAMVHQLAAYVLKIDSQPAVPEVKRTAKAEPGSEQSDVTAVYAAKCAHCHGADGRGQTILGRRLRLRDMRSSEAQQYSDSQLEAIIAKGMDQGRMPGFQKKLGPDMVAQLAAYVRELSGGAPIVATKRTISAETNNSPESSESAEPAVAAESTARAASQKAPLAARTVQQSTAAKLSSAIIPASKRGPQVELVDLNSASKKTLLTLPGITEADAQNIIGSRPYKSTLQFKTRNIVAPETYARIADRIVARQARTKQPPVASEATQDAAADNPPRTIPALVPKY